MLKEAIEESFVPVMVPNNQSGASAEIVKRFKEPAWNYQVIRFLNADAGDIIPRKDKVWTLEGVAGRMVSALEAGNRSVPAYLTTLAAPKGEVGEVAFAMHCFWTGEANLGGLDGVLRTEAGWLQGREVTRVWFDRGVLDFERLLEAARIFECARAVFSDGEEERELARSKGKLPVGSMEGYRVAKASDQKRQIPGTPVAGLELNPRQATKVNAWVRRDLEKALEWLSPGQRAEVGGVLKAGE